jgi:asparagine synthase (glutamine-hydrolysing)
MDTFRLVDKINLTRLYQYLNFRYVPTKEMIIKKFNLDLKFRGIHPNQVKIINYSEKKLIEKTKKILYDSIEKEIPNKKFGVFISGGLDSTILLHILSEKSNKTIRTFTMGFGEETDELKDARIVANFYGTKHREIVIQELLDKFPKQIQIMGFPKRNLWGYYLAKFASRYVKFVFDGLGGDELFGGYTFRYKNALKNPSPKNVFQKIETYIKSAHIRDFIPNCQVFGPIFDRLSNKKTIIYEPFIIYFNNRLEFLNQIFLADLNVKCKYDFLPLTKLNEANGLKTKTPWLSDSLIKFAFTIPPHLKYRNGIGKYILKKAFRGIIPEISIIKKKQGFGPNPLNIWKKELKYWVDAYLLSGETVKEGFINKEYVKKILDKQISEKMIPHYNKLWDALAFEIWFRLMLDKKLDRC